MDYVNLYNAHVSKHSIPFLGPILMIFKQRTVSINF